MFSLTYDFNIAIRFIKRRFYAEICDFDENRGKSSKLIKHAFNRPKYHLVFVFNTKNDVFAYI